MNTETTTQAKAITMSFLSWSISCAEGNIETPAQLQEMFDKAEAKAIANNGEQSEAEALEVMSTAYDYFIENVYTED